MARRNRAAEMRSGPGPSPARRPISPHSSTRAAVHRETHRQSRSARAGSHRRHSSQESIPAPSSPEMGRRLNSPRHRLIPAAVGSHGDRPHSRKLNRGPAA